MKQYVLVGTYPDGHKRAFVLTAENQHKAIQTMLEELDDCFINIEVIDTYGRLSALGSATIIGNDKSFYRNVHEAMLLIVQAMGEYEVTEALDENGEETDAFHERFENYYSNLSIEGKESLLSLLGTAKGLVNIVELAGYDCL